MEAMDRENNKFSTNKRKRNNKFITCHKNDEDQKVPKRPRKKKGKHQKQDFCPKLQIGNLLKSEGYRELPVITAIIKEPRIKPDVDRKIIVLSRRQNGIKLPKLTDDGEIEPLLKTADPGTDKSDGSSLSSTPKEQSQSFSFLGIPRRSKCLIASLAILSFGASTCFSLIAPFFPQEAARKGISQTVIGMIFGVFELVIFITSPIFGNYLTRIGSKFAFISGIMVCGSCAILFGVLDKCPDGLIHVTMLFLCRIVEALGAAGFVTACLAIVTNTFPNNVSAVVGIIETLNGMGLMAGPVVGGALYSVGGYGFPFFFMGSFLILSGIGCIFLMPASSDVYRQPSKSILDLLRNPYVWSVCYCITAVSFSVGFVEPTLSNHLLPLPQMSGKPWAIGLIFLIEPGIYALCMPIWGWLSDSKGQVNTLMIIGCFINAVGFLLLGPSPILDFLPFELSTTVASLIVSGVGIGMSLLPSFRGLLDGTKDLGLEENFETFGIVSGIFNSCFSLGAFFGPTTAGFFVENIGFNWSVTVVAGVIFMSGILLFICAVYRKVFSRTSRKQGEIIQYKAIHEYVVGMF